jgi:hypothetical protein
LLNLIAFLFDALTHEKGLEAKFSANTKALKEAKICLAAVEAKSMQEIAAAAA